MGEQEERRVSRKPFGKGDVDALRGDKSLGEIFSFHRLSRTLPLFGFGPKNASMKPSGFLDCPGKPERRSPAPPRRSPAERRGKGESGTSALLILTLDPPYPGCAKAVVGGCRIPARVPSPRAPSSPARRRSARPSHPPTESRVRGRPPRTPEPAFATERPTTAGFFIDFATTAFPRWTRPCVRTEPPSCAFPTLFY